MNSTSHFVILILAYLSSWLICFDCKYLSMLYTLTALRVLVRLFPSVDIISVFMWDVGYDLYLWLPLSTGDGISGTPQSQLLW